MDFTDKEVWLGGFYELAIELGPPSDQRLKRALECLWSLGGLDGPYERNDLSSSAQSFVRSAVDAETLAHLYGVATLPGGKKLVCGSVPVREDNGSDWLVFYIPMGALEHIYEVGFFPFSGRDDSRLWRSELDDWLASIGEKIFASVPYELALIGHEMSGEEYAEEIGRTGVPSKRWAGYLFPHQGILQWFPPTEF